MKCVVGDREGMKPNQTCIKLTKKLNYRLSVSDIKGFMMEFERTARGSTKTVFMTPKEISSLKDVVVSEFEVGPIEKYDAGTSLWELELQVALSKRLSTTRDMIVPRVLGLSVFLKGDDVRAQVISENVTAGNYAILSSVVNAGLVYRPIGIGKYRGTSPRLRKLSALENAIVEYVGPEKQKGGALARIRRMGRAKREKRARRHARVGRGAAKAPVEPDAPQGSLVYAGSLAREKMNLREPLRMWGRVHLSPGQGRGFVLGWMYLHREAINPVLRSLAMIHALGYVHGDIKGDNVAVRKGEPFARIFDFGMARPAAVWNKDMAASVERNLRRHNSPKYKELVHAVLGLPEKYADHMMAREFITPSDDQTTCLFLVNSLFFNFESDLHFSLEGILEQWHIPEVERLSDVWLSTVVPLRHQMIAATCDYYDMVTSIRPSRSLERECKKFSKTVSIISGI